MSTWSLDQSRQWCHDVMRTAARNFYYGMSVLPPAKRNAMFALYAYMRHIDDIADETVDAGSSKETAARLLEEWRAVTHSALAGEAASHPMFPALIEASRRFCIPPDLLDSAIDGQLMDLQRQHYHTFEELKHYCYCVASTVGIAAVYIWGFRDSDAIVMADDRGVAFQLTNILRDLREDFARGRVYLPQEDLRQFGVDLSAVMRGGDTAAFVELMNFQVSRAEEYYQSSANLESMVEPDARATLRTMTGIYHGILDQIRQEPLAVLSRRVGLSSMAKISQVVRQVWFSQVEGVG